MVKMDLLVFEQSHNPYFNRWFSAMLTPLLSPTVGVGCHNPYFNRWFSAIVAPS